MKYVTENGDRVTIVVEFHYDEYGNMTWYNVRDVLITPRGKRKARSLASEIRDSYSYRSTPYPDRPKYVQSKFVEYCTQEQIDEAIIEKYRSIVEQINPKNVNIDYRVY